jgi:putative transposase
MYKAHIIKLKPTVKQDIFFRRSCGVARFSYNWALAKWQELYEAGEKPTAYTIIKLQNSIKKEQFPWMYEVGKSAPQYAIHDLGSGYKRMYKGIARHPKFKKKGVKESFVAVEGGKDFKQKNYSIRIPVLGWVKCHENLRFEGKVNNVVIKRTADMWFAVVNVECISEKTPIISENQTTVGVDLGIKTMMTLSDGSIFDNPKALKSNLKSLKRMQRSLCRKQKGSINRKKKQVRLARKHYKVFCIRKNAINQATAAIINKYDKIVIEDLNVKGMTKNYKLAQAIGDISFSEIRRQLEYKAKWAGKEIVVVDRFFPSSKLCSCCGNKKETLKLSERVYKCEACGYKIDRDLNAAINLANYSSTSKSEECEACGETNSSSEKKKRVSVNQELKLNTKQIKT